MREILFRAKRLDNGEWVEGNLIFSNDAEEGWEAIIIPITNSNMFTKGETKGNLGFENWHRVDPETIGQFTGLMDKNGVKIFDGDIVRHDNENLYGIIEKGQIYWDEEICSWRRTSNGAFHHGIVDSYRITRNCCYEVIGNIFDNPELLKGGAE